MDFIQNAKGNTVLLLFGNFLQISLTIYLSQQSSINKSSACMQDCLLLCNISVTSRKLSDSKKYLMKDHSLILCGQILIQTTQVSHCLLEVLVTCLVLMWQIGFCMKIELSRSTEHINYVWKDIKFCLEESLLLFGALLTIAIDLVKLINTNVIHRKPSKHIRIRRTFK